MKTTIIFTSLGLALSSFALAHSDHDHEGPTKKEMALQVKEGKLCMLDEEGSSLGAVIEKNGKMYRCIKAYGENLTPHRELVWVEVALKEKGLSTLP